MLQILFTVSKVVRTLWHFIAAITNLFRLCFVVMGLAQMSQQLVFLLIYWVVMLVSIPAALVWTFKKKGGASDEEAPSAGADQLRPTSRPKTANLLDVESRQGRAGNQAAADKDKGSLLNYQGVEDYSRTSW